MDPGRGSGLHRGGDAGWGGHRPDLAASDGGCRRGMLAPGGLLDALL